MEVSKRLGAGLRYTDIDEMLAEVDKDGDGKVQFDGEYTSFRGPFTVAIAFRLFLLMYSVIQHE